ncbi:MAG: hypothetical protein EPN36_14210 [Rhodanobacteraceae bacterium]|nr:MAG: hypothetical protein EPN36_14210 [Rhodanobacteraceae bacterium]
MGRKKRKRGKRHGNGGHVARRALPYLEMLLADLQSEKAEDIVREWCRSHAITPESGWLPGTSKTRFVLIVKSGEDVVLDGNDDLPALVHGAWPLLVGELGELGRKLHTLLSPEDNASFKRWMESGRSPRVREMETAAPVLTGQVLLRPWGGETFPVREMRGLMLTVGDALLSACGIKPPERVLHSYSGVGIRQAEVVGDALLEMAVGGVFNVDDEQCTILVGNYVLPVAHRRCMVHVAVALVSVESDAEAKVDDHLVAIDGVTLGWLGLTRAEAEPLWQAVSAAIERKQFASQWDDEKPVGDSLESALFEWTARQLKEHIGMMVALEAAEGATTASETKIAADRKRDERRWRDREDDLVAQRDAARASLERERANIKRVKMELAGALASANHEAPVVGGGTTDGRIAELEARCADLQAKASGYAAQVDTLRQALHAAETERDAAVAALGAPSITAVEDVPAIPATLADLGTWAHRALDDRVVVVPRALRAARKSNFADPGLVYRSLEALRDAYWAMKFGGNADAQETWQRFLRDEHLSCSQTGAGPESRHAETYHVSWAGRRVPLDMHLQGNSGRHETRQFRIYFHADEVSRRVIVGHLPSHLRNNAS